MVIDPSDRPRPTPDGSARAAANSAATNSAATNGAATNGAATNSNAKANHTSTANGSTTATSSTDAAGELPPAQQQTRGQVNRVDVQPSQVVAAAGTAIVTAARVGKLLSRSGWRIARQLPGARAVEREAQRLQEVAIAEARKLLQVQHSLPVIGLGGSSAEEQRAANYIHNADPRTAPLRSAMSELLERSVEASRTDSREYLYGTIIAQLVPDEARILAALSDGRHFAACDVVLRLRRGAPQVLLANASSIGRQAGLVSPDNVPTYLTRLKSFGLIDFGAEDEKLDVQYDILSTDAAIQRARDGARSHRKGTVKIARKTLLMSAFGAEFWAASDPSRPAQPRPALPSS